MNKTVNKRSPVKIYFSKIITSKQRNIKIFFKEILSLRKKMNFFLLQKK